MLTKINAWLLRVFADSDVNKLLLVIAVSFAVMWLFIQELAPLLGAVLIAYVLDGAVSKLLQKFNVSRAMAVTIVIIAAMLIAAVTAYTLPQFLLQLRELGDRLPQIGQNLGDMVQRLNDYLPDNQSLDQDAVSAHITEIATAAVTYLFNNLFSYAGNLFSLLVYLVLLPLLVFFMLRDKEQLAEYLNQFMPRSTIFAELWGLVDEQFGSYIRGKVLESVLVGASTWIVFLLLDLDYALALASLVGLSVFIPFVGIIAVTFPVVLFAYLQFGWSAEFAWVTLAYAVIQLIDGQILVPLLFSEVIKVHPVALFSALIFFGNLWGVWGVFFAIPLASLVKCVINVINKRYTNAAAPA